MKSSDNVEKLIERANAVPSAKMNRRTLNDIFEAQEASKRTNAVTFEPNIWRAVLGSKAGCLAAVFLVVSSLAACFVLSGKVANLKDELQQARRDVALARPDDSATINLYLKEHQDVIARNTSLKTAIPTARMCVSQHDILYYEFFENGPEYTSPGIIVRGPSYQHQIDSAEAPVISNGHTLTLLEAQKAAGFELKAPPRFYPGYCLDKIRRIEGRDALQLLYTDGVNSVSLFEQSLNGQRGLTRQDFREYAVYQNAEQAGGTIFAWRDDAFSYVLIGNIEMSQLMDMARVISAGK